MRIVDVAPTVESLHAKFEPDAAKLLSQNIPLDTSVRLRPPAFLYKFRISLQHAQPDQDMSRFRYAALYSRLQSKVGTRQGFCVNLSVDRCPIASMSFGPNLERVGTRSESIKHPRKFERHFVALVYDGTQCVGWHECRV